METLEQKLRKLNSRGNKLKEELTRTLTELETVEKERPQQGKVIATGPGKMLENGERSKMQVKEGDKVLFSKYGPTDVKVDGKEYLMIKEDDILAIIK